MNYDELLAPAAKSMRPSGIRKFFDLAAEMPHCISLGVGEPDFKTPWTQGKSSIAQKGMLYAAKIMALTAIDFLQKPELVNKAREELTKTLNGETYPNPLPKDLKPEIW